MPRIGATPFAFPEFKGATRRLVLVNLAAFFALFLFGFAAPETTLRFAHLLQLVPQVFLHGALWQPITYSFVHPTLVGTLFELLSLWFLAGFLEPYHGDGWVTGLYIASVLGTAAGAIALYAGGAAIGRPIEPAPLFGSFGAIFGMLIAIGYLYGDVQFLMFFVIGIKARYLAIIYGLICFATLFSEQRAYAFAQLGGALVGLIYVRAVPRRGFSYLFSERWYGLRNAYYRWKRRRASRKFEVYMRSQGRTVRFDSKGRQIDDAPDDKSRWN
ncbi:MAG TPA: rhomboid family intramembrane serine protease [Terracidiphilus sp.]|jgi:membrane associated rhomboid family serine protease|nr:rhomboid family intramembrane serine protease [Terracidiphilus sp.]